MRIAFLNIYNGVVDRGAETYVKELAKRLAENNDVTVIQAGDPPKNENYKVVKIATNFDRSRKSTAGTVQAKLFVDYWSRLIFIFTLKALPVIRKNKFDIVIPVNGGWMPAILRLATWLSRRKMVISGQSGIGWDDKNNLWCFPDRFIALSTYAQDWAERINPFVKSVYIPNGVDTGKFGPKGKKIEIKLKKPIILCAAALTKSKRVDLVIKAVSRLKNTSLLIAGDGDLRNEIDELGNKLLQDRYLRLKLPFEEMPAVYRSADLFTLVSEPYYSFEIVLAEAMASGLPVVVNNDPIRKEIVGEAGIFVNPENIDEYASALIKAKNNDWADIPQKQAANYDWDKIAASYTALFKSLLS